MNNLEKELKTKIDNKTKPIGALGKLEEIAFQIGCVQNSLEPKLQNPVIVVFAGDHGIAKEGVSAYPQEVTHQMVLNFLKGGAAINVFARQNNINLKIVDSGVNFNFDDAEIINQKIDKGTRSFLSFKAMTKAQLEQCFDYSSKLIDRVFSEGCNIIGFGEMGIGNTSSASMIMHYICDIELKGCVGRGTGVSDEQFEHKLSVLEKAQQFHGKIDSPKEILQTFGGFEVAQIAGAILAAYEKNMMIMVDGFIAGSAFLVAHEINPKVINNSIFCHKSHESGHKKMLEYLDASPLLDLDLRLGEGTACAVAYPIIKSAIAFLDKMASFEDAGVSNKS